MRRLSSLAWRSSASRRLRSLLTAAGIALGVAAVVAAMAADAGVAAGADRAAADLLGRSALRVEAFEERGLGDESLERIRTIEGVSAAAPSLERRTFLTTRGSAAGEPFRVIGIDPGVERAVRDVRLAAGEDLAAGSTGGILVTEAFALEHGLALGSEVTLDGAAASGPATFRVQGIVAGDRSPVDGGNRTAWITLAAARELFDQPASTAVDIVLAPGVDRDAVVAEIERRLTLEPYVIALPSDIRERLESAAAAFRSTMALIALVAVFSGAFLIFNTVSMTVAERVREVALLRAAGATTRQVSGLFLVQAALLGTAGSAIGLGLGLVFGWVGIVLVGSVGQVTLAEVGVGPLELAAAFVLGMLVSLASALEPAWRAARIAPVDALRREAGTLGALRARLRWLVVVTLAVALAGAFLFRGDETGASAMVRPMLVYGILLAACLMLPAILGPLGRLAGIPFALVAHVEERLTRGSLVRDRSRSTLTAGALTVGVAMIVAIGAMSQLSRNAATAWLDQVVPGSDVVGSIRPIPAEEGIAEALAAIDGVAAVSPIGVFEVSLGGRRLDAAAVDGGALLDAGGLRPVEGDLAAALRRLDAGGTVILPRELAERLGAHAGETLTFVSHAGAVPLTVGAVVEHSMPGSSGETLVLGWNDALGRFGVLGADLFAVRYTPGAESTARPAVRALAEELALELRTVPDLRRDVEASLGRLFGLFDAIALIAVVIAALGVVNTLQMNVVERVREFGVLRAIGLSRRQVWRLLVVEAGILGLTGGLVGAAAGSAVVVALVVLGGIAPASAIDLPWATMALAAALAVVLAMLAAVYPARVASRMPIVRALQFE